LKIFIRTRYEERNSSSSFYLITAVRMEDDYNVHVQKEWKKINRSCGGSVGSFYAPDDGSNPHWLYQDTVQPLPCSMADSVKQFTSTIILHSLCKEMITSVHATADDHYKKVSCVLIHVFYTQQGTSLNYYLLYEHYILKFLCQMIIMKKVVCWWAIFISLNFHGCNFKVGQGHQIVSCEGLLKTFKDAIDHYLFEGLYITTI
jgi:hypothetical protein